MKDLRIYVEIFESPPYLWGKIALPYGQLHDDYGTPVFDTEPCWILAEYVGRVVANGEPATWGELTTQDYLIVICRKDSDGEPDGRCIASVGDIPYVFRLFLEGEVQALFESYYPKQGKRSYYFWIKPRIRVSYHGEDPEDETEQQEEED